MTAALEGGEWSAARPGRTLSLGKTQYQFLQEAEWTPGPVWTGGKSCPYRNSIPDRPPRSQSLYRLSYPAHLGGGELLISHSGRFSSDKEGRDARWFPEPVRSVLEKIKYLSLLEFESQIYQPVAIRLKPS